MVSAKYARGRDWGIVDGDPTPGRPDGIRIVADGFASVEQTAEIVKNELSAIRDRSGWAIWEGAAAERFAQSVDDEFVVGLRKMVDSYGHAAHALQDYAIALSDLQQDADRSCSDANAADGRVHEGERRLKEQDGRIGALKGEVDRCRNTVAALNHEYHRTLAQRAPEDSTYDLRYSNWRNRMLQARSRLQSAEQALGEVEGERSRTVCETDDARSQLAAARRSVADIRSRRESAERQAASRLEEATRIGVRNKSLLEQFVDAHLDPLKAAWEWVSDLENLDKLLGWISTALTVLAIVCLVLGCIPGLQFLWGVAHALFVVVVVLDVLKAVVAVALAADGRKSWGDALQDVAWAVVGVVTLGAGSGASKAVNGGAKGAASASKWAKLGKWTKRLTKAIDYATGFKVPFAGKGVGKVFSTAQDSWRLGKLAWRKKGFAKFAAEWMKNAFKPVAGRPEAIGKAFSESVDLIDEHFGDDIRNAVQRRGPGVVESLKSGAATLPPMRIEVISPLGVGGGVR